MRPQKQLYPHRPADGLYGDCYGACLAVILDLDVKDMPNFGEIGHKGGDLAFHQAVDDWLKERGLVQITFPIIKQEDQSLDLLLITVGGWSPRALMIFGGTSRNGTNHAVVICGGQIVCDPADSGIVSPCDDGYYWVTVFQPIALTYGAVSW